MYIPKRIPRKKKKEIKKILKNLNIRSGIDDLITYGRSGYLIKKGDVIKLDCSEVDEVINNLISPS